MPQKIKIPQVARPTENKPISKQAKIADKRFDMAMSANDIDLTEMDQNLDEEKKSLKKQIWDLAKMEALVHSDPKLSAVYNEMEQDGEEKYGYHYNETIMNIIFNEYVLNSVEYLQKYKNSIPVRKKRRDKSGIDQLQKKGAKKQGKDPEKVAKKEKEETKAKEKNEGYDHNNSLPAVMEDPIDNNGIMRNGFGDFDDRDYLDHRINKKYDLDEEEVDETTGAASSGAFAPALGHQKRNFVEMNEGLEPASIEIVKQAAQKTCDAIKIDTGKHCDIHDVEEGSFELSLDGKKYEGGSYVVDSDGNIKLVSIENPLVIGNVNNSVEELVRGFAPVHNVDETTTSASSGAYETPYAFAPKGKERHSKKPYYKGGAIVSESDEYLTNPTAFKRLYEALDNYSVVPMAEHHLHNREEQEAFILDNMGVGDEQGLSIFLKNLSDEQVENLYKKLESQSVTAEQMVELQEAAKSKNQQKFMGMVRAIQKGEADPKDFSPAVQKAAKDMKKKDVKDFASTKHDDLPKKVKKEKKKVNEEAVEYVSDMQGEEPFEIGGIKFQYVKGRYPDGKIDIAVYRPDHDIAYSFDWFRKEVLGESMIDDDPTSMALGVDHEGSMKLENDAKQTDDVRNFGTSEEGIGGHNGKGEDKLKNGVKDPARFGGKTKEDIKESYYIFDPENLVTNMMRLGLLQSDEYHDAIDMAKDAAEYYSDSEDFGSSDMTAAMNYVLRGMGKKTDFINGKLTVIEENMNEDRRPSALVQLDRLKKDNEAKFKEYMKDSGTQEKADMQDELTAKDQVSEVGDNPYELGEKIEADKLKQHKGEAFDNVGNSTNDNNKEIPKRNLTTDEQDHVQLDRGLGMHDIVYDNKPDERFEERMQKDMGDEFYDLRQKKMEYRAKAPMYNKDAQPVDDAINKVQYNRDKAEKGYDKGYEDDKKKLGEASITGKYKDELNNTKFTYFKLSEAVVVEKIDEGFVKLNLDGLGNTFTQRVDENEVMRDVMNAFDFYFNGESTVRVKKGRQTLSEAENKKVSINEEVEKMKKLWSYNGSSKLDTSGTKKNRGF
jgi:hypothetical protein